MWTDEIPGNICLILDLWTSPDSIDYVFITGQYIDQDWKLHKNRLGSVEKPFLDTDTAFSHAVDSCLSDYNMDGRLFTVTINQPLSVSAAYKLRAMTWVRDSEILNGQLLVKNCLARTLSSVAKQALMVGEDAVKKVRDIVKFVKSSQEREFLQIMEELQKTSTKSIALDDQSRWDTTYEMLVASLELNKLLGIFSCLSTSRFNYQPALSLEIWNPVHDLCYYLKPLFDTISYLRKFVLPTTNNFYVGAFEIKFRLLIGVSIQDTFVRKLTMAMQEKFDKYWQETSLVLAVAVIMDPRFKMKFVEISFSKIYGLEAATYVKLVDQGIHDLFLEYDSLSRHLPQKARSELDEYLEELLLPNDVHEFDVLGWWKLNETKYPTLSKMARDILAIPVCTVPEDSVFNTVGKEMDN